MISCEGGGRGATTRDETNGEEEENKDNGYANADGEQCHSTLNRPASVSTLMQM